MLILPVLLGDQLAREARNAFPRECCGLIEGIRRGGAIEGVTLHAVRNLAVRPDRFEIDPAAHLRLLRALRGSERDIVGCYHSHPDGSPVPSPRDREWAVEEGFVWLIAGVAEDGSTLIAAHEFAGGDFRPLGIARPAA